MFDPEFEFYLFNEREIKSNYQNRHLCKQELEKVSFVNTKNTSL